MNDAFGWDDSPEVSESKFKLLPEGEAIFTIRKLERKRSDFGRFGTINVAVVTFLCSPLDGDGEAEIDVQFGLHKDLGWKIVSLATACGLRKSGDGNQIDPRWWAAFQGECGRCMIKHRKYKSKKDGSERTANEIESFLAPEAEKSASESKAKAYAF